MKTKKMNVVGIMSGTSLDGVDYVLTRIGKNQIDFKDSYFVKFPKTLKGELLDLAEGRMGFREAQKLHFSLGDFYAKKLKLILTKKKWKVDLVGLHGQTVFHEAPYATTQIGEPSYIKKLGVPVVSDFRSKLIAYRTEAAPLAPVFHDAVMSQKEWGFLNLGGMSNITYKDKTGKIIATDLGPANVFLDKYMNLKMGQVMDKGGAQTSKGLPDLKVVQDYFQAVDFFKRRPPKSCGREEFSDKSFQKLLMKMKHLDNYDALSTLAEISLQPILKFLKKKPLNKLVVSGGGAKNKYFMKRLKTKLYDAEVLTSTDLGWAPETVEGAAFALLAYKKHQGETLNLSYLGLSSRFEPLGRVD